MDIHSHILPGLDDGPQTLAEAVEMVRMAAAAGTTDIVASPHANLEFAFDPESVDEKIRVLEEASGRVLRIHRGCDFHLSAANIQDALEHPTKYTINGTRYLLAEFPDVTIPASASGVFQRFGDLGITPIVTHPERNALLRQDVPRLASWVASGCLVQVTAQSFLGRFGPAAQGFAEELIRRGLIHFIASDGHWVQDRPPVLDQACKAIAASYGEDTARTLFIENPAAALAGTEVLRLPALGPATKTGSLLKRMAASLWPW